MQDPSPRTRPIVEVRGLRKEYPLGDETVVALKNINLSIMRGEICCIFGTSGSGKSTLLNQLAGMEKPTRGEVRIGGVPISRLPLGEVFSGVLEGVCIPFLLLYINMPKDTFLSLRLSLSAVEFTLRPLPLLTLLLFMAVPALCTAGIMLANNICDLRRDVSVNRYTLPFFLGKSRAMRLFGILYLLAFLAPCLMVLLGWLPSACLLLFLLVPPVRKNLKAFQKEQRKDTTFHGAIRNYILLVGGYTVGLFLGGVLERVF